MQNSETETTKSVIYLQVYKEKFINGNSFYFFQTITFLRSSAFFRAFLSSDFHHHNQTGSIALGALQKCCILFFVFNIYSFYIKYVFSYFSYIVIIYLILFFLTYRSHWMSLDLTYLLLLIIHT